MTQSFWPFDTGPGANVREDQWRSMAALWMEDGPVLGELNQLLPFADSTGPQVKVNTGRAWLHGHYYENDDIVTLPIAAADLSDDRIDRVVVRADFVNNTIALTVITGDPAAVPVAPPLVQSTSIWDIPNMQVAVAAGSSTVADSDVTDERQLAIPTGEKVFCRIIKTGTQNIDSGDRDVIKFNVMDEDKYGIFNTTTHLLAPPAGLAGWWEVQVGGGIEANTTGRRDVSIFLNDAQSGQVTGDPPTGIGWYEQVTNRMNLAVGDEVDGRLFHTGGAPLQVINDTNITFFWAQYLGRAST